MRYASKLVVMASFAANLADLSTCRRIRNGCVIVPKNCSAVHAIGYNGPARGRSNEACRNTVGNCGCAHAEANAIARLDSMSVRNAILLCTTSPCEACASLILNSGSVDSVFYRDLYRDTAGYDLLIESDVTLISWNDLLQAAHDEWDVDDPEELRTVLNGMKDD